MDASCCAQNGIDASTLRLLDGCVEIPMIGVTRSLNAHVSTQPMIPVCRGVLHCYPRVWVCASVVHSRTAFVLLCASGERGVVCVALPHPALVAVGLQYGDECLQQSVLTECHSTSPVLVQLPARAGRAQSLVNTLAAPHEPQIPGHRDRGATLVELEGSRARLARWARAPCARPLARPPCQAKQASRSLAARACRHGLISGFRCHNWSVFLGQALCFYKLRGARAFHIAHGTIGYLQSMFLVRSSKSSGKISSSRSTGADRSSTSTRSLDFTVGPPLKRALPPPSIFSQGREHSRTPHARTHKRPP